MKLEELQRLTKMADDIGSLRLFMSDVEFRFDGSTPERELRRAHFYLKPPISMEYAGISGISIPPRLEWRHVEMLLDVMTKELEQECAAAGVEL